MENVLKLFGVGPFTTSMVTEADMILSLQEDHSYQWWIRYEYRIKGKNHIGFRANVHKLTSNLFFPGQEKAEALDDWDKRYIDNLYNSIGYYINIGSLKFLFKRISLII